MSQPVRKILIVTKPDDPVADSLGNEIADFLALKGVETIACEHRPGVCGVAEESAGRFDLILVLGGDGTFIGVARRMHFLKAPLMGINLGRVGFLTQLHQDHWEHWLLSILTDGIEVSSRLSLEYDVIRCKKVLHSGLVINDLVVSRGVLARLIRLSVSFDGIAVSTLRADGLIISTPTGSSAYGVSAGGPLLHADLPVYCVTPVCPFLNSFKPMVLPAAGVCRVKVEEVGGEVNLTEDGQSVVGLQHGDEIIIRRSGANLLVVDLGPDAYFEKLKNHGFLTER